MKVAITTRSNYIMWSIPLQSAPDDLNKWREFLCEVLKFSLEGMKFYLFTLSPQKYSLGYELKPFEEFKVGKEKVLINYFERSIDKIISEIVNSEEFERGLLKIIPIDKQRLFDDLIFAASDYATIKDELITCEDDGTSFYWYNPHMPADQIQEKLKKTLLDFSIPY
jgi:hypothetical protein